MTASTTVATVQLHEVVCRAVVLLMIILKLAALVASNAAISSNAQYISRDAVVKNLLRS